MYSVVGPDWLEPAVTEAEDAAAGVVETVCAPATQAVKSDSKTVMMKAGFIGVRVLAKLFEGKVSENLGGSLS